jgi:simple sugar transport system substrate-binding protein
MKNLKTKFLASVLLASLFLTALACEEETAPSMPPNDPPPKGAMGDGPKGDGPKGPGGKMGDGNPMERVQKEMISEGSMTVCTDAPYEPFEFQDEDGNWTGFDMDIMREISGRMGLDLEVKVVPFDGIWLLPAAGECDVVASAMTITEDRAKQTLFTDPYFDADQSLLVKTINGSELTSLESLSDKAIAVQTGTTGESYAQDNAPSNATIVSFDEPAAMFLALESGEVDAIMQDLPVNADRAQQNPNFTMTAMFPTGEQYGFAVSPDKEYVAGKINDVLDIMKMEGVYDLIFDSYFGATAEIKPIKIGMILVGPRNDKGWSQAHFEGGEYVVDKMGGEMFTVDFVNPSDSPDLTIPDVVSDMINQGAQLIFATSDDMRDGITEAAAMFPDTPMIFSSGDTAWKEGEAYRPELTNLGNIMGEMEYGQMIAGCAAAIKSKDGKIGFLGPLINAETRRLANSTYLGALACAGDKTIDFKVTWIGFWFHIPGFTLDPTQVANDFYDEGRDVVVSHIDTSEALVVAGQRAANGESVWAVPYDYEGACDQAPEVCLGVNYFNWGPAYMMAAMHTVNGSFQPMFEWIGPNWSDMNDPDSSMIGWLQGDGMTENENKELQVFIDQLSEDAKTMNTGALFKGPLNYQDGSVFLKDGEVATDQQIWYAPQLLEGMIGDSSAD